MLIFDRTNLHCSSSVIDGKKIGLTTFTKKSNMFKNRFLKMVRSLIKLSYLI